MPSEPQGQTFKCVFRFISNKADGSSHCVIADKVMLWNIFLYDRGQG